MTEQTKFADDEIAQFILVDEEKGRRFEMSSS